MRLRGMLQLLLSLEKQLGPKRIWWYPPDKCLQNVDPVHRDEVRTTNETKFEAGLTNRPSPAPNQR